LGGGGGSGPPGASRVGVRRGECGLVMGVAGGLVNERGFVIVQGTAYVGWVGCWLMVGSVRGCGGWGGVGRRRGCGGEGEVVELLGVRGGLWWVCVEGDRWGGKEERWWGGLWVRG